MSLLDKLLGRKSSASTAKDRLMITLAHERAQNSFPFLEEMREEILAVVKKYVSVKDVHIRADKSHNIEMLEIDVTLGNR